MVADRAASASCADHWTHPHTTRPYAHRRAQLRPDAIGRAPMWTISIPMISRLEERTHERPHIDSDEFPRVVDPVAHRLGMTNPPEPSPRSLDPTAHGPGMTNPPEPSPSTTRPGRTRARMEPYSCEEARESRPAAHGPGADRSAVPTAPAGAPRFFVAASASSPERPHWPRARSSCGQGSMGSPPVRFAFRVASSPVSRLPRILRRSTTVPADPTLSRCGRIRADRTRPIWACRHAATFDRSSLRPVHPRVPTLQRGHHQDPPRTDVTISRTHAACFT